MPEPELPRVIIVDLDGTVADNTGRPFTAYELAGSDTPIWPIIRIVTTLVASGRYRPVYMTGREEFGRDAAQGWLDLHGLPPGPLYMRATGDHRNDVIAKREMFEATGIRVEDVEVAFDDRLSVIGMWRALGITVLDVAGNTF